MTDPKPPSARTQPPADTSKAGRIDDLLRAKAGIEDSLKRYQRFSAVLFTDIEGSTAYFTRKGDLAGRMMVQRHDDLLFPVVHAHEGRVVKTTGDGMLAAFDEPAQACRAAAAMQRAMLAFNGAQEDSGEELHIHIAIHAGVGFHDENDIYGNLVNIAARVEKLARRDQILLTEAVYGDLEGLLRERCGSSGEHALKGLEQPLRVYELDWRGLPADGAGLDGARLATILATDVEDSARLWQRAPEAMRTAHARYEELVREAVGAHGGEIFKAIGDAMAAAFDDALAAALAAIDIQRALAVEPWPAALAREGDALRVRIGMHTGRVELRGGVYVGPAVSRSVRLHAVGGGGQVLLTGETGASIRERLPPGFRLHEHGVHALQGTRGTERILELSASGLPEPGRDLRTTQTGHPAQRVLIEPGGPSAAGHEPGSGPMSAPMPAGAGAEEAPPQAQIDGLWTMLGDAVRDEQRTVVLTSAQARAIIQHKPKRLEEYWLSRFVEWSQPRYRLDTRFVQLSLLIDRGEDQADERWQVRDRRIDDLGALFEEVPDPAMVILAPPGSGKSTILRRLELDAATAALRGGPPRVTFFVQLNHFRPPAPAGATAVAGATAAGATAPDAAGAAGFRGPGAWLAERWHARYPDLPPLDDLLAQGQVTLLLDGLNEIPTVDDAAFRGCVRMWKDFVSEIVQRQAGPSAGSGNRCVFSCRSLDYSAPLSSPTLRVPQVRIEPMSDRQIRQYLKLYCPAQWAEVWQEISSSSNIELLRTPYFLRLMVEQVEIEGRIPQGRAELFTGLVRNALRREVERDNPVFDGEALLSSRDRRQIVSWRWKGTFDLPERGALIPGLGRLAHRMQQSLSTTSGSQVRVDFEDALDMLDHERAETMVRAGEALAILDEDPASDEVLFVHQLVQEYFAARELGRRPDPALVRAPWRAAEVSPGLEETLRSLGPADPLPPLPTTGWEETTLMAAAMTADADAFVRGVAGDNLVLAARCAAQRDIGSRLGPGLIQSLRGDLFARMRDPAADLRARIAAALALGDLGGPPYERRRGPHGDFLMPPFVAIAGGAYRIGSDAPYEYRGRVFHEELPACVVELAPFALAQFAVTNAEWACFMAGGGYEDERFWEGEQARAWLRGVGTATPLRNVARYWRKRFLADRELIHNEYAGDRMDWSIYELWQKRLRMDEDEFERHLVEHYPERRQTEPRHWREARYNNPMQPVIGIVHFEARAYAAWLATQTGAPIRLPSEAEWEAAARGREGRVYAYGDTFDPLRGNTVETHVRQPTPVGVFPGGDTPEGVADMTGNTFELTRSLWGKDPFLPDFAYPYDARDGREDPDAPDTVSRVGRGGSWYVAQVHARAAYRGRDRYDLRPDDWLTYRGCRVAMSLPADAERT
jgi:class 3 adenylate cyclase/formylglycine-generating enzyme required for sulfatase activity